MTTVARSPERLGQFLDRTRALLLGNRDALISWASTRSQPFATSFFLSGHSWIAETHVSPLSEGLQDSSPWAWTARVSYVRLELEKGHLSETKQLLGLATGRKGRTGGSALGSLGGGEAPSAPHRLRAHYKHCNLVSAPALIKGSLDTLRPLQITD